VRFIIAILALAGVWVSVQSLRIHYSTETHPCYLNEKWDCDLVEHSLYSEVKGVPVATMGIAGYLALTVLALMGQRVLVSFSSLIGMGYALYLAHIEKDVLMVWCLYCVLSLGIMVVITLFSLGWLSFWGIRSRYEERRRG
jgi:vitamin-K-epoxide reductase (warfarin-sensitive)